MIYQELKLLSDLIDTFNFQKTNRNDFSHCPLVHYETPLGTDSIESQTNKEKRIQETIDRFCKNVKEQVL